MHLEQFEEHIEKILCDDLEVFLEFSRGFLEVRTKGDHIHLWSMPFGTVSGMDMNSANTMLVRIAEIQAERGWEPYREKREKREKRSRKKKAADRKKDRPEKCSIEREEV